MSYENYDNSLEVRTEHVHFLFYNALAIEPDINEVYYYVIFTGTEWRTVPAQWEESKHDLARFNAGNVFTGKEEIESILEHQKENQ